jgi:hypothetical protein
MGAGHRKLNIPPDSASPHAQTKPCQRYSRMEPIQEHNVRGEGNLDPSATQSGWTTRSLCCPAFQEEVAELFQR